MNPEIEMEMRPKIRYWVPAACMQEEDLRQEIQLLYQRGFGGVEVVSLGTQIPEIDQSEDGWGHEKWEFFLDVIADETKKLGMTMDLANGPGWPIAMPSVTDADHPAALRELTYSVTVIPSGASFSGELSQRKKIRDEGTPRLLAICGYARKTENTLIKDSYINLMPYYTDGNLKYVFPKVEKDWVVFAFYEQPACQKVNAGQQYVIDHLSRKGTEACEKYWEKEFTDHEFQSMESIFCDSLEYEVAMDWTPSLPKVFEERRGYDILPYLPVIGMANTYPPSDIPGYRFENMSVSDMINRDYLEVVTELYCENHLQKLQEFAKKKGIHIRYQVAYNKPFDEERCGMFVDIPENEALGRASIDGLKTMAAAVHLGRKQRYSFECAAEFGHSYGQNYEDLLWWVKRSLMAGCNSQVMHGASYSGRYVGKYAVDGYLPQVQWPGYESFFKGVSNYWNRTLSLEDARGCIDTIARMNTIFRSQAKVDCVIYRSSYVNDGCEGEYAHYMDGGALSNAGYSYEFASEYLLNSQRKNVRNNMLDADGVAYRCLIIPEIDCISAEFAKTVEEFCASGLPVVYIGKKPVYAKFYSEYRAIEDRKKWQNAVDKMWKHNALIHVDSISKVTDVLRMKKIFPRIQLNGEKTMMTATHKQGDRVFYVLYANNCIEYTPDQPNEDEMMVSAIFKKGTTKGSYERPGIGSREKISVKVEGMGRVQEYDPWSGTYRYLPFTVENGCMSGSVEIEEDEMKFLVLDSERTMCINAVDDRREEDFQLCDCEIIWDTLELYPFKPDTPDEKSFLRSGFTECVKKIKLEELRPWKELQTDLMKFCGRGVYTGCITIKHIDDRYHYILELGQIDDTFQVKVNGKKTAFPDQVMKRVEIGHLLHEGENDIEVTVTSNLYNYFFYEGYEFLGMKFPYRARAYGMYETEGKKIRVLRY